MQIKRYLFLMAIMLVALPIWAEEPAETSSQSDIGYRGWGLRVGLATDPDQVVGGVQFNFGEFTRNLRFQPDVQLGFGDDATTLFATAPVYYRWHNAHDQFTPYAGGGIALGVVNVDLPPTSSGDETSFEIGGRATGGLEWARGDGGAFAVELSLGFGDIHDVNIVALWNFGK
jgi:opacity protein-like surface antigen